MADEENQKRVDLPYGAEYAKSSRALCKACKEPISAGSLRMAIRTQSRFFDGMQDNWFHFECFWRRSRKTDINEASIRGMEWLKWEDQERVRDRIKTVTEGGAGAEGLGTSTPKQAVPKIEHAKASSGKCFQCKEKIQKGEVRIGYKLSNYHPRCLHNLKVYQGTAKDMDGYEDLEDGEKKSLDELFGKGPVKRLASEEKVNEERPAKKNKVESVEDGSETLKKLKEQSEILWEVREKYRENLSSHEMEALLIANGRQKNKKGGPERMLDTLVDCAVFGVPDKCKKCESGVLFFSTTSHTYQCSGNLSEDTKCIFSARNPKRSPFKIPKKMKEENDFLATYEIKQLPERIYSNVMLKETPSENVKAGPSTTRAVGSTSENSRKPKSGGKQKMLVKNGCTIDPRADKAEKLHVYIDPDEKTPWQANLGSVDLASNRNSYYKLQLLEHDEKKRYYVFRSWGRVGTSIGDAKTEKFKDDVEGAKAKFEKLFLEKTHNNWEDRLNFKKHPDGFDMLEVEFDANNKSE